MELILPLYNVHPYLFLKNLGKKSTHYTQQNMVPYNLTCMWNFKKETQI